MRKFLFIFLFFSMSSALAANSPLYLAIKAGMVDGGEGVSDAAVNTAFDIGYVHNRHLATEFEISRTLIDGETRNNNEWRADSWSIFAALRTSGSVKLKAKVGLSNIEGNDDLSLAAGLGVSYWAMGGLTEIEFTRLDDDITFISLGVNFFY